MGWYYRIARKYTLYPERKMFCKHTPQQHKKMWAPVKGVYPSHHKCYKDGKLKRNYFYCIVEFYPAREGVKKNCWSMNPYYPSGDTKEEVIESIKMMLKDAKRYPILFEKEPYNPDGKL